MELRSDENKQSRSSFLGADDLAAGDLSYPSASAVSRRARYDESLPSRPAQFVPDPSFRARSPIVWSTRPSTGHAELQQPISLQCLALLVLHDIFSALNASKTHHIRCSVVTFR